MFDLAGLTCGHYLIPFWTFFGATLIGKAIVKMHIQQLAVIIAFNEELLDKAISFLAVIPVVGTKFQQPLKKYLMEQKRKLHDKTSSVSINYIHLKFTSIFIKKLEINFPKFLYYRKAQRQFLGCLINLSYLWFAIF